MKKLLLILFFISLTSLAKEYPELTQVPEDCLKQKKFPCLVKAKENVKSVDVGSKSKVSFISNALVKFESIDQYQIKINLVSGNIIFDYNYPNDLEVNGVPVGKADLFFLNNQQNVLTVYRSQRAEFLTLKVDQKSASEHNSDQVQTAAFPTLDKVTQFVSQFIKLTDKMYKIVQSNHEIKLKDEAHQQQVFLQRKIANEEAEQKNNAEARQKKLDESKKLKDLFFMRTFKQ